MDGLFLAVLCALLAVTAIAVERQARQQDRERREARPFEMLALSPDFIRRQSELMAMVNAAYQRHADALNDAIERERTPFGPAPSED